MRREEGYACWRSEREKDLEDLKLSGEEEGATEEEGQWWSCSSSSSASTLRLEVVRVALEARRCQEARKASVIRRRLLMGCSALARSPAEHSEAASERLAKDLDLPEKQFESPLLRAIAPLSEDQSM